MKYHSYIIGLLVIAVLAFGAYSRGKQQFQPYVTCARTAHTKAVTLYVANGSIAPEGLRYLWNELTACDAFLPSGFAKSHVPPILSQGAVQPGNNAPSAGGTSSARP